MENETRLSLDSYEYPESNMKMSGISADIPLVQNEVSSLKSMELNKILVNDGQTMANIQNENNESDISDDETFQKMRIRTKHQTITDTDSEDLENSNVDTVEIAGEGNQCNKDTPSELDQEEHLVSQVVDGTKKKQKRLTILDSDSDVDEDIIAHHFNSHSNEMSKSSNNHSRVIDMESKAHEKTSWTALCDSDSDEDEDNNQTSENIQDNNDNFSEEVISQPTPYKKKNKPKTGEHYTKTKKMTGKEAAQQRREIQSESQRMVREMNVSLPYHRPKAFTLKEFLARRPKFSTAIPVPAGTSPSVAIKMSHQQLEIISQKLKQHEKEVKEFYKSESEPEDDEDINDKDYIPPENNRDSDNQQTEVLEENLTNVQIICHEKDKVDEIAQDSGIDIQEVAMDSPMEVSDEIINKISDITNETNQELVELGNESEGISAADLNNEPVQNYRDTEKIDENHIEIQAESDKNAVLVNEICNITGDICATNDTETVDEITTTEKELETQVVEGNSMEYEFNLDDMEENSENILPVGKDIQIENDGMHSNTKNHNESFPCGARIETTSSDERNKISPESVITDTYEELGIEQSQVPLDDPTIKQHKRFEYTDLDREIENFGTIEKPIEPEKPKLSRMDLMREKLANTHPRLSGGENEVIDLDREIARPNEVTKLMQRFVQHTTKIHGHKSKVKLNIVSVESGEIHKETVDMVVDEDESMEAEEKPGAKLQKLRNELQNQMSIQRLQNWQKKINPQSIAEDKDSCEEEKSDCEAEDAILDDDEEEEVSESSEEEYEEEQDNEQKDELRMKSKFLDNEADESGREEDTEECDEADESDREEDTDECNEAEEGDDEDEIDEEEKTELHEDEKSKSSSPGEEVDQKSVKRTMKRILKGFTEDSDEEEDQLDLASQRNVVKHIDHLNKSIEGELTEDDDYLPPNQPSNLKTPVRPTTVSQSKSDFDFLTPVSYITGLNNLNSASKSKNNAVVSPFRMPNMPSPLKELNWQANLQKKLFTDSEITNSQAEAIADLCSDKSSFTQEIDKADGPIQTEDNSESEIQCTAPVNTQDILNVCSGEFVHSQEEVSSSVSPTSQDLLNLCSGEFTGVSQVLSAEVSQVPVETHTFSSTKEVKCLGAEEDLIISQLLDEEEMEKFKKKFDSPLMTNTQRRIVDEFEEVVASGGVIDSDEDDDEVLEVKKRVSQKKLMFSDESSDEEQDEETIDLHDEIDEDEEGISPDNVAYDSEENEVEYINNKAKMADFFDKEAELSESEWGSADEDEKDLDTMEFEQGDNEKFDEKKMRNDLEKIHMKRMLDDDTREVKLLQELLLEDGELHGTGRERKFRWKNIDSLDETDGTNKEDEDVGYLEEEGSEEQWRKKRHEIEMFLKEKQLKSNSTEDDDDLLNDSNSQLLKIGHKVIQNSFQETTPIEKPKAKPVSPDIKSAFSFMNKRGSFLSRKDQVLQRLTDYNKQTNAAVNSAKNSRNFLFQTVAVGETISTAQEKKRKAADGTPKVIKKLRLSDNMSPAVRRKKNVDPPSAKAKLF